MKRYLAQLMSYLLALFGNSPNTSSDSTRFSNSAPVPGEPLTRYVYSTSHFSISSDRVKAGAFMPDSKGKTSVFRVSGLLRGYIRDTLAMTARQDKEAKCAGHFHVRDVLAVKLRLDPNNIPERHANIVSWPSEKEEQKTLAQELASSAEFELYPQAANRG